MGKCLMDLLLDTLPMGSAFYIANLGVATTPTREITVLYPAANEQMGNRLVGFNHPVNSSAPREPRPAQGSLLAHHQKEKNALPLLPLP